MEKSNVFLVIVFTMVLAEVICAQQEDITLVDNETLPGISLLCFRVVDGYPQYTQGVIDLYIDYNGNHTFEDKEKVSDISFTPAELAQDDIFCFVVRTPSLVTIATKFLARVRVQLFLETHVIFEEFLSFMVTLEPFTTVADILARTKSLISRLLPKGTAISINSKIDASLDSFARENFRSAGNTLGAAINELEAVRGKSIADTPISARLTDSAIEILKFIQEPPDAILAIDTRRDFVFGGVHSAHGVPILFRVKFPPMQQAQPTRVDQTPVKDKGIVQFYSMPVPGVQVPQTDRTAYGRNNLIYFWPLKTFDSTEVKFIQIVKREVKRDNEIIGALTFDHKLDLRAGALLPTWPHTATLEPQGTDKEKFKTITQMRDFASVDNPWANLPAGTAVTITWSFVTWVYSKDSKNIWSPIGYYTHSFTMKFTTGENTVTNLEINPPQVAFTGSDGKGEGAEEVRVRNLLDEFIKGLQHELDDPNTPEDRKQQLREAIAEANKFLIR